MGTLFQDLSKPSFFLNTLTDSHVISFEFQDESLHRLLNESEALKEQCGHLFDATIVNHNIDETIEKLIPILDDLHKPQWVPSAWMY